MSAGKRLVRQKFRDAVFQRDSHRCRTCGVTSAGIRKALGLTVTGDTLLDAHHITDRNLMPAGGYVLENGISLCPECHQKAEVYHETGVSVSGYSPDELYALVGSSYSRAIQASKLLQSQ